MSQNPIAPEAPTHSRPPACLPGDWDLPGFDFLPATRVLFGAGSASRIREIIVGLGARRILVVTDEGVVRAGHLQSILHHLGDAVDAVGCFDRTRENPDTDCVDACVQVARSFKPDALIGLGGGSSMDTAKACNFLLTNGGRMSDYWGVGRATKPMLPFIAVPTTAGTGSECQSAALIADSKSHQKMACLDRKAAARVAILDPSLTLSMPPRVTSCTGVDALAHAIETAVTRARSALSMMHSREAAQHIFRGLPVVLRDPQHLKARGEMLLGAAYAGIAIEASMLGAAHSAANPLTARFGVVHGVAVGVMLPHVVRYNAQDPRVAAAYADLAASCGLARAGDSDAQAVDGLIERVNVLLDCAGMPGSLAAAGVERSAVPMLAEQAAGQWTAAFNPRPVGASAFVELYEAAFEPRPLLRVH